MTVTSELKYHLSKGHERGCPIRNRLVVCDCRYDMETTRLIEDAIQEIKRLENRVGSLELKLGNYKTW